MKALLFFTFGFWLFSVSPAPACARDCWLSAHGSGSKDGSSAAHAYAASEGRAQRCWNETSPDGTMHVLAGNYTVQSKAFWKLKINSKNDGAEENFSGNFKTLAGEGKVSLQGPRPVPYSPSRAEEGGGWITVERGAGSIAIESFHVSRVAEAVTASQGENQNLRFRDLHFKDTRQNLFFKGKGTRDILIERTSGLRYSKRHVRFGNGVSHARVSHSYADADFLDADFAVGFDAEKGSHDIEFLHSTSRANVYTLSSYWNGDGFKSEGGTFNIRWEACSAFDNGDGGFDVKTPNAVLKDITALRNGRNIRIWSPKTARIENALGADSVHRGGEGLAAGLWSQGSVECRNCTFRGNQIQVFAEEGARIRLYDSVLSMNEQLKEEWIRREDDTRVDLIRTPLWKGPAHE